MSATPRCTGPWAERYGCAVAPASPRASWSGPSISARTSPSALQPLHRSWRTRIIASAVRRVCLGHGNCPYILRYFTQVPVELVIAIAEPPRVSSGQQRRVKVQMPEWDDLIVRPLIQIDRKGLRYTRSKV